MSVRRFTKSEVHYLKMLPAVANVSSSRISYSDAFRDEATRRYLAGESPVRIFREAGLDPKIVGYKRIERAFARWKDAVRSATGEETSLDRVVSVATSTAASADASAPASAVPSVAPIPGEDPRDRLITSQALRIAELEQQLRRFHALAVQQTPQQTSESR